MKMGMVVMVVVFFLVGLISRMPQNDIFFGGERVYNGNEVWKRHVNKKLGEIEESSAEGVYLS